MAENVNITIKAFDKTKKGFGSVASGLKKVTGAVFSMRTALVGAAGLAGFGLLVKSSLSATDSLAKTASKIGTTTEALSALRYAADITGVATTTMDMALQRFTRRTAEAAKGTGEAKGALQRLGISARELVNMPLDQRMLVLADAFSKQTNESEKLALAFKLFDSEGAALVNTLSLGREGLTKLLGEAKALGAVMSSDAAQGVEKTADEITKLKAIAQGMRDQFVAALAPAIGYVVAHFTAFFKKISKEKGGVEQFAKDMAISFLKATVAVVKSLDTLVTKVGQSFQYMREKVSEFKTMARKKDIEGFAKQIEIGRKALQALLLQKEPDLKGLEMKGLEVNVENLSVLLAYLKTRVAVIKDEISSGTPLDWSNVMNVEGFEKTVGKLIDNIENGGSGGKPLKEVVVEDVEDMRLAFENWQEKIGDIDLAMQDLAQQGMNKFTDAFTDAITGAKNFSDAMRDMAKSVVDSLIKMLVQYYITKPLFDAITGMFGGGGNANAAGNAAGTNLGGSMSMDGGGFTGYGSRSGGVDGKGGFNAILHPNETVIDHTKGQSSGVVVQQTINVTTGVQQTVRAEIVQLMPQIAQAAKGAVADARLRGGNFSKAMAGA
jgi:hypothetical protein